MTSHFCQADIHQCLASSTTLVLEKYFHSSFLTLPLFSVLLFLVVFGGAPGVRDLPCVNMMVRRPRDPVISKPEHMLWEHAG